MSDGSAIVTRALTKHYGKVKAVSNLDLDVRCGEVYGFLGRNGAGKTTTIRMLLGLIHPDAGTVEVLGRQVKPGATQVLAQVGYLVETASAYPNLTVRENLEIQRRLTGTPRQAAVEAMKLMHLTDCADRRAGVLSLGNKQRLALARALLHRPELLILDEPANALDPAGIVEIRELLRDLAQTRGVTIFISSHILTEIALLADRVGIVHEGRLVEELGRDQLSRRGRWCVEVSTEHPDEVAARLGGAGFAEVERIGPHVRVLAADSRVPEIARVLLEAGSDFTGIAPAEEDLEAHFLRLTGGVD